jgi:hypothetical protein
VVVAPVPSYVPVGTGVSQTPEDSGAAIGNVVPYTGDGNASHVVTDPNAPAGLYPMMVVIYDSTGGSGDSLTWFAVHAVGVGANGNVVTAAFGLGTIDVGTGVTHTGQNVLNNTYTAVFYYGHR